MKWCVLTLIQTVSLQSFVICKISKAKKVPIKYYKNTKRFRLMKSSLE